MCGFKSLREHQRDVAQLGSAAVLGTEGHRFKSCHPDFALVAQLEVGACLRNKRLLVRVQSGAFGDDAGEVATVGLEVS